MKRLFLSFLALPALLFAQPASAAQTQINCVLTLECATNAEHETCKKNFRKHVVDFCILPDGVEVYDEKDEVKLLSRILDETPYAALPYAPMKDRKLDVGQWPDTSGGTVTFVMREDSDLALRFEGDPLTDAAMSYLKGRCSVRTVQQCKVNR